MCDLNSISVNQRCPSVLNTFNVSEDLLPECLFNLTKWTLRCIIYAEY